MMAAISRFSALENRQNSSILRGRISNGLLEPDIPNIHTNAAIAAKTVIAGLRLVHISSGSLVFLLKELESGAGKRGIILR